MKHLNIFLFIFLFSALFTGCKKNSLNPALTVIDTPVNTKIYKSCWFNADVGFFCGGEKTTSGYIYYTTDGGQNWTNVYQNTSAHLTDIFFINDSVGYCCGDNLVLLKTQNKGITWQHINLNTNYSYFTKGTLRGIFGNENCVLLVGGKNFNVGTAIRINNGNVDYTIRGFNNELSCGFNFNTTNYVSCGYGTGYKTNDFGANYTPTTFSGDNITACVTINQSTGFACGYNGGVYKTSDGGQSFEKILDHNRITKKRINFNGITFINQTTGWVVGNYGEAYQTTDAKKFKKINFNTNNDLLSIVLNKNNQAIVSTSSGKLIRFNY